MKMRNKKAKLSFNFNFNWDRLKYFIMIVECGSINAAAQKLGMKQSSLSRQLDKLEDEIGVELFRRHARGVILNEYGEALYELAKQTAYNVHRLGSVIYEKGDKVQGKLRIVVYGHLIYSWLTNILHKFCEKYPDVRFEIIHTNDDPDTLINEADAMLRVDPTKILDLIQKDLLLGKFTICTTQKYIDAHGMPKNLADLANHKLLTNTDLLLTLGCPNNEKHEAYIQTNSAQGLLNLVLNGNGIAILPSYTLSNNPTLIPILEEELHLNYNEFKSVYFCYHRQLRDSKKLCLFRKFLMEETKLIG